MATHVLRFHFRQSIIIESPTTIYIWIIIAHSNGRKLQVNNRFIYRILIKGHDKSVCERMKNQQSTANEKKREPYQEMIKISNTLWKKLFLKCLAISTEARNCFVISKLFSKRWWLCIMFQFLKHEFFQIMTLFRVEIRLHWEEFQKIVYDGGRHPESPLNPTNICALVGLVQVHWLECEERRSRLFAWHRCWHGTFVENLSKKNKRGAIN